MSEKINGGPAFPSPGVVIPGLDPNARQQGAYEGMTLRDYFAAKAMQGICAHPETLGLTMPSVATRSYEMADAMLKARES
jgi:hypothetical protein